MLREADAVWTNGAYTGSGRVSVPSGILTKTKYVFGMPESIGSTSPGELLAAAIATSVSAIVVRKMGELGGHPPAVNTHAAVTLNNAAEIWKIHAVHLDITVIGGERENLCLEEAVDAAQRECPIASELNLEVSCTSRLLPVGTPAAA